MAEEELEGFDPRMGFEVTCERCKKEVEWIAGGVCVDCIAHLRIVEQTCKCAVYEREIDIAAKAMRDAGCNPVEGERFSDHVARAAQGYRCECGRPHYCEESVERYLLQVVVECAKIAEREGTDGGYVATAIRKHVKPKSVMKP